MNLYDWVMKTTERVRMDRNVPWSDRQRVMASINRYKSRFIAVTVANDAEAARRFMEIMPVDQ